MGVTNHLLTEMILQVTPIIFSSTKTPVNGRVKFLDLFLLVIFAVCTYGKSPSNHRTVDGWNPANHPGCMKPYK